MPKLPIKSLSKVSKLISEGRESALNKLFSNAEKTGKTLYRHDTFPRRLSRVGFVEGFGKKHKTKGLGKDYNDVSGIFYTKDKSILPDMFGVDVPVNVEAVPFSGTKHAYVNGFKFDTPSGDIKKVVEENNPDFLHILDLDGEEVQQLKPNKVLARIRVNNKWRYRVLGAAGVGAGATTFKDKEANAMPLGVVEKAGTKLIGPASRTAGELVGTTLPSVGKVIKQVVKGVGDKSKWRDLIFEDGTHMTITTDQASQLTRAAGTARKMSELNSLGDSNLEFQQALRSMVYHEDRAQNPLVTRRLTRAYTKNYLNTTDVVGTAPETVFVKRESKYFSMPKKYAEILEKQGLLRIDRSKAAIQSLGGK